MKEKVYVFGHKKPDTDSVCSAIAYANLKNAVEDKYQYEPVILGDINKETKFVLEQVGLNRPRKIKHLKPQIMDMTFEEPNVVDEDTSIKDTLDKIAVDYGRVLPVKGIHEHLIGVVSISDLLPLFMGASGDAFLQQRGTPYKNLVEALNLKLVWGRIPIGDVKGRVVQYEDIKVDDIGYDDVLFCDYSRYIKRFSKGKGAGVVILANAPDEADEITRDDDKTVFVSDYSLREMMNKLNQIAPIRSVVKKENLEYFTTYETLDDVRKNMMTSRYSRFPVVDENGHIKGMISRGSLLDSKRKKAILMDHNEKGQSIDGIEEVTLLEVIDHHRVADIQTMGPLYFRVEPVGCTCTIVARMYEEKGVEISPQMAKLMLSAIMSDTLIFKSPTSTEIDERIANKLADIAGVSLEAYGMKVVYAGSDFENATPESVLHTDVKQFMFGAYKVKIAQTNTSDFEGFYEMYDQVIQNMDNTCKNEQVDLFVLLVTDVVIGGTEMIARGKAKWIAEQAFKMRTNENSIFLPDVFSRKKQIVPVLMQAAGL